MRSFAKIDRKRVRIALEMIARGIECPPSSSCGRLFDAVSTANTPIELEYEAQAAMQLEPAAQGQASAVYSYASTRPRPSGSASCRIREIIEDKKLSTPASLMASNPTTPLGLVLTAAGRAKRDCDRGHSVWPEAVSSTKGSSWEQRLLRKK